MAALRLSPISRALRGHRAQRRQLDAPPLASRACVTPPRLLVPAHGVSGIYEIYTRCTVVILRLHNNERREGSVCGPREELAGARFAPFGLGRRKEASVVHVRTVQVTGSERYGRNGRPRQHIGLALDIGLALHIRADVDDSFGLSAHANRMCEPFFACFVSLSPGAWHRPTGWPPNLESRCGGGVAHRPRGARRAPARHQPPPPRP